MITGIIMKNFKLSSIIPVYNGEKFIKKCIKSILNQSIKNLEIIIIDDCSTDNTLSIINNLIKTDSRIKLYCNDSNQGISHSRNLGISKATGTHIHFIDADDYLYDNAYDSIYNFFLTNKADILIFDYYQKSKFLFWSDFKTRNIKENINLATQNNHIEAVLKSGGVVVWNKIFSLDFIIKNNIKFINNIIYEDIPFFWVTILSAKSIYYLKDALYYYNYIPTSIMNSKLTIHKAKYIVLAMLYVKDFLIVNDYWKNNNIKILYIKKLFQSYISFLSKVKTKKSLLFNKMYDSIWDIDLKDIKPYVSKWSYFKYSLLKNNNYYLFFILC